MYRILSIQMSLEKACDHISRYGNNFPLSVKVGWKWKRVTYIFGVSQTGRISLIIDNKGVYADFEVPAKIYISEKPCYK